MIYHFLKWRFYEIVAAFSALHCHNNSPKLFRKQNPELQQQSSVVNTVGFYDRIHNVSIVDTRSFSTPRIAECACERENLRSR